MQHMMTPCTVDSWVTARQSHTTLGPGTLGSQARLDPFYSLVPLHPFYLDLDGSLGPLGPLVPLGPLAPLGPLGPLVPLGPLAPLGPLGPCMRLLAAAVSPHA